MTRRPVLPGADELFRRTDTPPAAEVTELPSLSSAAASPALRATRRPAAPEPEPEPPAAPLTLVPGGAPADPLAAYRAPAPPVTPPPGARTRGKAARAAARTRHDEKITVYISADDLLALESARLTLRAQHGVAADRGRIVREAVSVLLADLEDNGEESVLVRRLKAELRG